VCNWCVVSGTCCVHFVSVLWSTCIIKIDLVLTLYCCEFEIFRCSNWCWFVQCSAESTLNWIFLCCHSLFAPSQNARNPCGHPTKHLTHGWNMICFIYEILRLMCSKKKTLFFASLTHCAGIYFRSARPMALWSVWARRGRPTASPISERQRPSGPKWSAAAN
jgi:hypothetical protein